MPEIPFSVIPYSNNLDFTRIYCHNKIPIESTKVAYFYERLWRKLLPGFDDYRVCRRYMCFDPHAVYDRFLMLDSDVVIKKDLSHFFEKLDDYDMVRLDRMDLVASAAFSAPVNATFFAKKSFATDLPRDDVEEALKNEATAMLLYFGKYTSNCGQVAMETLDEFFEPKIFSPFSTEYESPDDVQSLMTSLYSEEAREYFLHWINEDKNKLLSGNGLYQSEFDFFYNQLK